MNAKKILIGILSLAVLIQPCLADATTADYSQLVIKNGDINYLPVREAFQELGFAIGYNPDKKEVLFTKGESERITLALNTGIGSNATGSFSVLDQMQISNGRLYLTVLGASKAVGSNLSYKEGRLAIAPELDENKEETYTIDQLTAKALSKDQALAKAGYVLDRATEVAVYKSGDFYTLVSGTGTAADAANAGKIVGLESAKISEKLAKLDITTKEDTVKYTVASVAEKIIEAEKALDYLNESVAIKEQDIRISDLKRAQGLVSDYQNDKDKGELASLKEKVKVQNTAVQLVYDKMNKLIDVPAGSRYAIDGDAIAYVPMGEKNLEGEIIRVLESSPSIYALQEAVKVAELSKTYYVPNSGSENYNVKELDISKADNDLNSAKISTRKAMNDVYNGIKQLEALRASLLADLDNARKTQESTALSYSVGLVTALDVKKAGAAVKDLENQIFSNTIQHNALKRTFEEPWVTVTE